MTRNVCKRLGIALLAGWTVSTAAGGPAEPLVRILTLKGDCRVRRPELATFEAAREGRAYQYGSSFQTVGPDSSAMVQFSTGNNCLLAGDTLVTVVEDPIDPATKIVQIETGSIEAAITESFRKQNKLYIEHGLTICDVLPGNVRADSRQLDGLHVVTFEVSRGTAQAFGPHFEIPLLTEGTAFSAANSKDHTFNRLRGVKGRFNVQIRDAEGNLKVVQRGVGQAIKIWQSESPIAGQIAVTILIVPKSTGKQGLEVVEYRDQMPADTVRLTMESAGAVMLDDADVKRARKHNKTARPHTPGMPTWLDEL